MKSNESSWNYLRGLYASHIANNSVGDDDYARLLKESFKTRLITLHESLNLADTPCALLLEFLSDIWYS